MGIFWGLFGQLGFAFGWSFNSVAIIQMTLLGLAFLTGCVLAVAYAPRVYRKGMLDIDTEELPRRAQLERRCIDEIERRKRLLEKGPPYAEKSRKIDADHLLKGMRDRRIGVPEIMTDYEFYGQGARRHLYLDLAKLHRTIENWKDMERSLKSATECEGAGFHDFQELGMTYLTILSNALDISALRHRGLPSWLGGDISSNVLPQDLNYDEIEVQRIAVESLENALNCVEKTEFTPHEGELELLKVALKTARQPSKETFQEYSRTFRVIQKRIQSSGEKA